MRITFVLLTAIVVAIAVAVGNEPASPVVGEASQTRVHADVERLKAALLGDDAALTRTFQLAQNAALDTAAKQATPTVVAAIKASRKVALDTGTEPIPPAILRRLTGFFPKSMLDTVRYRVGWGDARPQPPLAPLFLVPSTKAMTLGEVVVFRDATAAADIRIWVHELGHVQQYERWGVDDFARRYVENFQAVEDDAWAVFDRYDAWARERGRLAATGYEPVPAVR